MLFFSLTISAYVCTRQIRVLLLLLLCGGFKKSLKIFKVVDLAVQCSASFQGNRMRGVRTLCEHAIKIGFSDSKTKFCLLKFSMRYKFVKISESGMPYFYEFDTDTCETSHTVFTPFTRYQIERFLRFICCSNKSIRKEFHR